MALRRRAGRDLVAAVACVVLLSLSALLTNEARSLYSGRSGISPLFRRTCEYSIVAREWRNAWHVVGRTQASAGMLLAGILR